MCFRLPANGRYLPVAMFCIALAMQGGLRQGRPQMHAGLPDLLPGLHQALSVGDQELRGRLPQAVTQTPGGVWEQGGARVRMGVMSQLEVRS